MISMTCPHCQSALRFQEQSLGQSGPCFACGGNVTVASSDAAMVAMQPAAPVPYSQPAAAMVAQDPAPPVPYAQPAQAMVGAYAPLAQPGQASNLPQQGAQEEVRLNVVFWIVVAIGCLFTLGLIGLFIWWYSRRYPQFIDPMGVTLRDGRRFAWTDLQTVNRVSVTSSGIPTVNDALHLQFPGVLIGFNAALFVDGRRHHATIRQYINQAFGA